MPWHFGVVGKQVKHIGETDADRIYRIYHISYKHNSPFGWRPRNVMPDFYSDTGIFPAAGSFGCVWPDV